MTSLLLFLSACSAHQTIPTSDPVVQSTSSRLPPATSTQPPPTPTLDPYSINGTNALSLTYLTRFGDYWVHSISWSPDGNILLVDSGTKLDFYDVHTYERIRSVDIYDVLNGPNCSECSGGESYSAVFSPDGKTIASTFSRPGDNILIWDAASGTILKRYAEFTQEMDIITFSLDGKMLAGCNGAIIIWDTHSGTILHILQDGEDLQAYRTAFSPDSTLLVSTGFDGYVRIWDTRTGSLVQKWRTGMRTMGIAFSPDGSFIAAGGSDDRILVWDRSGNLFRQMRGAPDVGSSNEIQNLIFNPQGDLLVAGTDDGNLEIYDIRTAALLKSLNLSTGNQGISSIAFSPDGRFLAVGGEDGNVRLWVVDELARQMPTPIPQVDKTAQSLYTSLASGEYIVFADSSNALYVMSSDGSKHGLLTENYGIGISADGRLIDTGRSVLSLITGTTIQYDPPGSISPDLQEVANTGCGPSSIIDVTGMETGIMIDMIPAGKEFCIAINLRISGETVQSNPFFSWSPDGRWLAYFLINGPIPRSGLQAQYTSLPSDGLYLVDTDCFSAPDTCPARTRFIHIPNKFGYYIYSAWSPDGSFIVVDNPFAHQFIVIRLQDGQVRNIRHMDSPDRPVMFALSPDNRWIAYSNGGGEINLQDLRGGSPIRIASGLENAEVVSWLTAPLLKVGSSFVILPPGDNLILRGAPSLDASGLVKLHTGDIFTVTDGPVQADGYTFWRVRSELDGSYGWVREFYGWFKEK